MNRPLLPLVLLALALSATGVVARTLPASVPLAQVTPALVPPAQSACFTASLNGAVETPPNDSPAQGFGTFVLSPDQTTLTYHIAYSGLTAAETAAHFHKAAPGTPGPVVYPLPNTNPKQGSQLLTAQDVADLRAGLWYVNIHTSDFPDGEIRGQIMPSNSCYTASLTGATEVPANSSTATGTGFFALSADQKTLVYDISFTGLTGTETVQHFHKAAPGVAGPVVYNLTSGSPKRGSQALTPQDVLDIKANLWYVNIHSTAFPDGEIRGQIFPATNCFTASLTGTAETPPASTAASGLGTFVLSPDQTALTYHIAYSGLSGNETAAHFHRANVGIPGPIVYPLPATNPKQDTQAVTDQDVFELYAGLFYVNIHTTSFPNGEIRGQLYPTSSCLTATLTGAAETPPNSSPATGTGVFALAADQSVLVYDISYSGLTGTETVQHFHRSPPGVAGPVVYPLPTTNPKRGAQALTPQDAIDIRSGLWYANIHTNLFPGGEIRGQILPGAFEVALPVVVQPEVSTATSKR